ncbi:PREDICTED: LOW QUALITY PROTEIN: transmembrane protein 181 [Condylura cristata]|uniref:LOW QUALITY PROTEIN: transmembrane protein 181 n=1 Tax=Condylura cristata TaxID=143302 RepID=UPI0003346E20|nr:PREDICTED: LOW QUALITY PROTEIN: transmembrane protein 181 [Condylura cristata]
MPLVVKLKECDVTRWSEHLRSAFVASKLFEDEEAASSAQQGYLLCGPLPASSRGPEPPARFLRAPSPPPPPPAPPPRPRPARRQPPIPGAGERGGEGSHSKGGAAGAAGGRGAGMDAEYPAFEPPLCSELKHLCKRLQEAYRELKEDLTPFRDDRYYRLAPMRLYTLSKRHFVLVFVVFFVCFGLTVFIGIKGPKVIQTSAANFSLNNGKKLRPIHLISNPLSMYNQQLWLTCVVELEQSKETSIQTSFPMTVKVDGVAQDGTTMFIHSKVHNRTRTLTCAGKCAEIIVAHLGYLNYTQYTVIVGFENLKLPIKEMNFTWKTYDPAFSQWEICFRFIFVVLTFVATCLFAHSLRKFSMRDWGIEQKWMSILLPLLLLYNDPFFPLSFLVNSWFPGMLDDLFQSVFLCALLLFWLCVYHGIRVQGERRCLTFYLPKFFIVGLLWLASVTLGIWQTVNELHDPMYQYRVDTGNFQGMKVFFMVVAAAYVLYLLFLVVRACSELRHMPYVDLRLKFLTALTFVVLVISIVILYLRFGAQVLQDNFVAELSAHYQNSAEFLSFYGLLNFYLYTLAFVYSPSKNAVYESQLKDNPAFSMLNDSDDDVIYGSDYEEMPLQNGQAIRAQYKEGSDSD